ncbi:acyl carrier protein [Corynebacterium durum]|uniref:acyl carrier protein n=1 Tax=Corynebacterium durum TaxID=61592 RepID=UPI00361B9107
MGEQHKATEQGPNAAVAQIIAKAAGVEAEDIGPEKRLVEDLGIDSLTAITLAVQLEQSTKVRIEESDARTFRTVGDIYAFLSSRP